MDYYEKQKRACIDLEAWLQDPKRSEWIDFCRRMRMKYGFSPAKMLKILSEDYPNLVIDHQGRVITRAYMDEELKELKKGPND